MSRKFIDCSEFPSESGCTLRISGEEEEVLRMATLHAVDVHGHADTPELHDRIRSLLRNESDGGG